MTEPAEQIISPFLRKRTRSIEGANRGTNDCCDRVVVLAQVKNDALGKLSEYSKRKRSIDFFAQPEFGDPCSPQKLSSFSK